MSNCKRLTIVAVTVFLPLFLLLVISNNTILLVVSAILFILSSIFILSKEDDNENDDGYEAMNSPIPDDRISDNIIIRSLRGVCSAFWSVLLVAASLITMKNGIPQTDNEYFLLIPAFMGTCSLILIFTKKVDISRLFQSIFELAIVNAIAGAAIYFLIMITALLIPYPPIFVFIFLSPVILSAANKSFLFSLTDDPDECWVMALSDPSVYYIFWLYLNFFDMVDSLEIFF